MSMLTYIVLQNVVLRATLSALILCPISVE